jgi:putative hydrolase of the HAD superfamily
LGAEGSPEPYREIPDLQVGVTQLISFDLWLTLVKSHPRFKPLRNRLLRDWMAPRMDMETFGQFVRREDREADRRAQATGENVGFTARVAALAGAVGVEVPATADLNHLYRQQSKLFWRYPPQLIDAETLFLLQTLRARGCKLALVSNTGYVHGDVMRRALAGMGLAACFDWMIFSNEIGYAKPDPRIFQALISAADVPAARITHIGDDPVSDVQGARGMGMSAFQVTAGLRLRDITAKIG